MARTLRSKYRDLLRLRAEVRALEMGLTGVARIIFGGEPHGRIMAITRRTRSGIDTRPRLQTALRNLLQ